MRRTENSKCLRSEWPIGNKAPSTRSRNGRKRSGFVLCLMFKALVLHRKKWRASTLRSYSMRAVYKHSVMRRFNHWAEQNWAGPMFPVFPKRVLCSPVAIHSGEHRTLFGKSGEHRTLFWEKSPMFPAIYQSLKIFKLWRDIRVMTANQRSTHVTQWPRCWTPIGCHHANVASKFKYF